MPITTLVVRVESIRHFFHSVWVANCSSKCSICWFSVSRHSSRLSCCESVSPGRCWNFCPTEQARENLLSEAIDDASCTVERAALTLLQHEQGKRAAHLRGVRAEEQALDAPDHHATPEASGDAAVVGSIVSLLHANTRRPSTAGRA